MLTGNIGSTVETKKAAMVQPSQEKGSGRTSWYNPGTGSYWKTSLETSERELKEDFKDRYETSWSF